MSKSAWTAMTKYHRVGSLNNKNIFSHTSGGWQSNIKVPQDLVSDESFLPGFQMATFLLYLHKVEVSMAVGTA